MGEWVFFSLLFFLFWFNFSLIGANDKSKVFYWSITKTKTIKIPIHPTHLVKLTATEESFPKTSTPLRPAAALHRQIDLAHLNGKIELRGRFYPILFIQDHQAKQRESYRYSQEKTSKQWWILEAQGNTFPLGQIFFIFTQFSGKLIK